MAENDPAAGGQPMHRAPQPVSQSLVGEQPNRRQAMGAGGLAGRHAHAYSTAMQESDSVAKLAAVNAAIADAARLARRNARDITLLAVSKTQQATAIRPLLEAGHRDFGENRVQEAAEKWPGLRAAFPDARLHLIGQLQSNKAEEAVALFDTIHSVDRPSLIRALGKAMTGTGKRCDCFLQVNIGDESQKGGCAIGDTPALLATARGAGLPVAGLMAIPPADVEPAPYFALLAKLARDLGLDGLSMGMSADYPIAVSLGATHVRVGTALFGNRR